MRRLAEILGEANHVFELNLDLFALLKAPSSILPKINATPMLPLLGDLSPTQSNFDENETTAIAVPASIDILRSPQLQAEDGDGDEKKEIQVEIVQNSSQPAESLVSLGAVVSAVIAVCLAHFLLVTSGLTGTAWMEKLESLGLVAPPP